MSHVKHFSHLQEFFDFNIDFIESNILLHYFLDEMIRRIAKREVKVHTFFNVLSESNHRLVGLLTEEVCLVYSDQFDEEMITLFSQEIEFEKIIRYNFAGNKQAIDALFKFNQATYKLQKHRIIYKCSAVQPLIYAPGKIQMCHIDDIEELTTLSMQFNQEYYEGQKAAQVESQMNMVASSIVQDSMYQWRDKERICSIAQTMGKDYDFPVIGHFYTPPGERKKGYGSSLIHAITKGLLNVGHEFVMLSTNALTPSSNATFLKVGYVNTGEYLLAYKNKD